MDDPAQNHRQLRAATEAMRSRQRIGTGGALLAATCVGCAHVLEHDIPGWLRMTLYCAAPVIVLVAQVPFLLSACPSCKGRYHQFNSIFRSADKPAPCACCGFQVDKHIPRYD
ncbi:MAG TPA: hypothetical protein VN043_13580 [Rhodanobacter sp.]|nr:hypothetical protein [Rhodanobacter sp.]